MFYKSWALWEQLTFVLGVGIVLVFVIGVGKLLYTNRIVYRQEHADEERRMKIEQLRQSGQLVDSLRNHETPFGVRAIQSGIEIEGIWISKEGTPVTSEVKLEHLRGNATDMLEYKGLNEERQEFVHAFQQRPASRQCMEPFRGSEYNTPILNNVHENPSLGSSSTRMTHNPRTSPYAKKIAPFDEESFIQSDIIPITSTRKTLARRSRASHPVALEGDSSAADNERYSTEASTDSDESFYHETKVKVDFPPESSSSELGPSHDPVLLSFSARVRRGDRDFSALQSSDEGDDSGLHNMFSPSAQEPSTTPNSDIAMGSLSEISDAVRAEDCHLNPKGDFLDDNLTARSHQGPTSPDVVPGELYVNKTARKVNSSFEIVPAGTLGVRPGRKGIEYITSDEESTSRRQSRIRGWMRDH